MHIYYIISTTTYVYLVCATVYRAYYSRVSWGCSICLFRFIFFCRHGYYVCSRAAWTTCELGTKREEMSTRVEQRYCFICSRFSYVQTHSHHRVLSVLYNINILPYSATVRISFVWSHIIWYCVKGCECIFSFIRQTTSPSCKDYTVVGLNISHITLVRLSIMRS